MTAIIIITITCTDMIVFDVITDIIILLIIF